jgi:hypothetical protein
MELSDGDNLYDRLGRGFTLVAFGEAEAQIAEFEAAASLYALPLTVVRAPADDGRSHYRARLILVRPDQFVAWAAEELDIPAGRIVARAVGFEKPI